MQSKIFQTRILFVLFFLSAFPAFSQQSVITSPTILYYGIDFTEAKFVGKEGFTNPVDLQENYLNKWNQLIINESSKYDILKFNKKDTLVNHIEEVTQANEKVDPNKLVVETLSEEDKEILNLVEILKKYTPTEKEQLGLLYAVVRFDKIYKEGVTHAIYFNTKTKEILFSDYGMYTPSGFGIRNYWAKTLYYTMKNTGENFRRVVKKESRKQI